MKSRKIDLNAKETTSDIVSVLGATVTDTEPKTEEEIIRYYQNDIWIETKKKKVINENAFAMMFSEANALRFSNGLFYTKHGRDTEESIAYSIWDTIRRVGVNLDVERTVKKLLGTVKLASTVPDLAPNPDVIPFANGDFIVSLWEFHRGEFAPVPYRLPVSLYDKRTPTPYFDKWISDLLQDEDARTLQEYLGYTLISSTKAQKALFLVGEGGSGKSGLGVILEAMLGDATVNASSTKEFLEDKFKLPELEHKLVLYDDDLDTKALDETGVYKKLISNTIAITADRKYGQPFKFTPKVKIIACCNKLLSSHYDQTSGFWRRLLPLVVKPIAPDFKPDLRFYDHLKLEADGIVYFALLGLRRLIQNKWVLTESQRTKDYLTVKQSVDNPLPEFFETCFEFDPDDKIGVSSTEVLNVYAQWCRLNSVSQMKPRTVQTWIADNSEKLGIRADRCIKTDGGKYVRGYLGLYIKPEWDNNPAMDTIEDREDGKIPLL